jgi:hypothetical protein
VVPAVRSAAGRGRVRMIGFSVRALGANRRVKSGFVRRPVVYIIYCTS